MNSAMRPNMLDFAAYLILLLQVALSNLSRGQNEFGFAVLLLCAFNVFRLVYLWLSDREAGEV